MLKNHRSNENNPFNSFSLPYSLPFANFLRSPIQEPVLKQTRFCFSLNQTTRVSSHTFSQGQRKSGRTGEGNKISEGVRNLPKTIKNLANYACFCSATMLNLYIIIKIMEKYWDFSVCTNSCTTFV